MTRKNMYFALFLWFLIMGTIYLASELGSTGALSTINYGEVISGLLPNTLLAVFLNIIFFPEFMLEIIITVVVLVYGQGQGLVAITYLELLVNVIFILLSLVFLRKYRKAK